MVIFLENKLFKDSISFLLNLTLYVHSKVLADFGLSDVLKCMVVLCFSEEIRMLPFDFRGLLLEFFMTLICDPTYKILDSIPLVAEYGL